MGQDERLNRVTTLRAKEWFEDKTGGLRRAAINERVVLLAGQIHERRRAVAHAENRQRDRRLAIASGQADGERAERGHTEPREPVRNLLHSRPEKQPQRAVERRRYPEWRRLDINERQWQLHKPMARANHQFHERVVGVVQHARNRRPDEVQQERRETSDNYQCAQRHDDQVGKEIHCCEQVEVMRDERHRPDACRHGDGK